MLENDLLEKEEARAKVIGNIQVLEKIEGFFTIPNVDCMTMDMVAWFYDVDKETIKKQYQRNEDEFKTDGAKLMRKKDFVDEIQKGQANKTFEIIKHPTQRGAIIIRYNQPLAKGIGNEFVVTNRGVIVFPRRAILRMGILLQESEKAKQVKELVTGLTTVNLLNRKEMKFKKLLEESLNVVKKVCKDSMGIPKTDRHGKPNKLYYDKCKAIDNLATYIPQCLTCDGKYHIDFYFPFFKIAVEYDEKYHNSDSQREKDKDREYQIIKSTYIMEEYKDVTLEDLKEWEVESLDELYEIDKECGNLYSYNLVKFLRIKEDEEIIGIVELTSLLTRLIQDEMAHRGTECKYEDLVEYEFTNRICAYMKAKYFDEED